jgi:dihydropteroate synthase
MRHQDTNFTSNFSIRANGKRLSLASPRVMGIVNLTPDSYFSPSRAKSQVVFLKKAEKMIDEGASIIDVGAVSTRPGASPLTEEIELRRLLPALRLLRATFPEVFISVDTFRSEVALAAAECGADIINDIFAGDFDGKMMEVVGKLKLPYIMMHMQGTPITMQQSPNYKNVVQEVRSFFRKKIMLAKKNSIRQLLLDPGFGFGKNLTHNYQLLSQLNLFSEFKLPLLAGVSRKSMITRVLEVPTAKALNGTGVIHTLALLNGANLLRVHDVREAVEAIKLIGFYKSI